MASELPPFHQALPVHDLDAASEFYCGTPGMGAGRNLERWVDLDFFGHQVTLHLVDEDAAAADTNPVGRDNVPARHFGVVFAMDGWQALADRL